MPSEEWQQHSSFLKNPLTPLLQELKLGEKDDDLCLHVWKGTSQHALSSQARRGDL